VVALLGPNGAGKTTTVELLEGYDSPTAGRVSVLGRDPRRGDSHWRARIGLVMQSTSLDRQLTVREALSVFAALFPDPRPVDKVLELIDLQSRADTRIGQLSGGQQRRVDLGAGIIGRPELLFLDEPTTGLDPEARRRIHTLIEQLGTTVLLTTHYLDEAERLADRLLVLRAGRLIADTTPGALRAAGLRSTLRLPLAPGTELPAEFEPREDELVLETQDVAATLQLLIDAGVPLHGLQVGPPSLEDAYLEVLAHA
jgi:ABC-2 type transport system ATP-binding protein